MNIYFIYPLVIQRAEKWSHTCHPFPPIGLVYIATVLKNNGHKVEIADRNDLLVKNNYDLASADKELLERIRSFQAQIVGFSATTPLMYDVIHLSKMIKQSFPDIINIVGGPHPTAEPKESLMRCPDIDLVVEGEGEMTMLDIANLFPCFDIPGVWSRKGNDFHTVGKRELIQDLDKIPIPDRSLLNMDFYLKSAEARHFFGSHTTIFSSRGCIKRCHYCAGPVMFPGKVRYHSPEYIIEEIERIVRSYKIDYIYFADDMFLSNIERVKSICDMIKKRKLHKKIKWICQLTSIAAKPEILKLMKGAGCILIECGFESGSQQELDRMNKKIKLEKNYEAAMAAHRVGIKFRANMIKGHMDQTEEDFIASGNFIKAIRPYFTHFNFFLPLPGTQTYRELLKRGYKIDWDECTNPAQNFTKMSSERFAELTHEIQRNIVGPLNKRNFKIYHIRHHFISFCKLYYRKNLRSVLKKLDSI